MRLRESKTYVRLATHSDALNDGSVRRLLAQLQESGGPTLTSLRDSARRGAAVLWSPTDPGEMWSAVENVGMHPVARLQLTSGPEPGLELAIMAGPHPYTGAYVVQLDFRFPNSWVDTVGNARIEEIARAAISALTPIWLHAHDVDDDLLQSFGGDVLARVGLGLADGESQAASAGREVSRGEFRYCPAWITWLGPEMLAQLDAYRSVTSHGLGEELEGGLWFRLCASPSEIRSAAGREAQLRLRTEFGFDELASRQRRAFGYWQRRGELK